MNNTEFKAKVFNTILIHVARSWERVRKEQPLEEMPYDNIESVEVIESIAEVIMTYRMVREFIVTRDGTIWNREGDGCSDIYIERKAVEIIDEILFVNQAKVETNE